MVVKLEDDDYMRFLNGQREHYDKLIDPVYKIFLEHLREDGKSYVLEMQNGDHDLPTIIKYERGEELHEESKLDTQISPGKFLHSVNKRKSFESSSDSQSDQVSGNSVVPDSLPESSLVDESYQTFLSHLNIRDNVMILQYDSIFVTYEEEKEASLALEGLVTESTVHSDEQGLVPYKSTQPSDLTVYEEDNSSIVSLDCGDLSDFKDKLMVILSRPYDQNEYEELLKEATDRKPLNRQKHLRSMSISYPTKQEGLSYLDHFPDLGIQIESADCHRRLTLLRGFFFWLKNLCHEGAFMPWASSSYDGIADGDYEIIPPLEIARAEN